ncbi:MAG: hypothetical protein ABI687_07065 [Flavitalea sp.]
MKKMIKTYDDLLAEKERLKRQLDLDKKMIVVQWEGLKSELAPLKSAYGFVQKLTKSDKSNPLLNAGLGIASDLLLRRFIFARAGWLIKLAAPLLAKNYSSHFLAEQGSSFLGKLKRIFSKKDDRHNFSSSTKKNAEEDFNSESEEHSRNGQTIG